MNHDLHFMDILVSQGARQGGSSSVRSSDVARNLQQVVLSLPSPALPSYSLLLPTLLSLLLMSPLFP